MRKMKRRNFLKLLTVAPLAPSVLAAKPKPQLTDAQLQEHTDKLLKYIWDKRTVLASPGLHIPTLLPPSYYFSVCDMWYSTDTGNLFVYDGEDFIKAY